MKITLKIRQAGRLVTAPRARNSRRAGSILLVAFFALFMMLGFCALAVDYGTSVVIKNHLQRTCDAAALAGATQLLQTKILATDQANATARAIETAGKNGYTIDASNISFNAASTRIRVSKVVTRKFLFGAAIGIPNGQVPATALAGRTYIGGMTGLDPLGVTRKTYETYVPSASNPTPGPVTLQLTRNTAEPFGPLNSDTTNGSTIWNIAALDLRPGDSGNSGAQFQRDVTSGNNNTQVNIGQNVDPLGSSITSQGANLQDGIQALINQAANSPWNDTGQYQYSASQANKSAIPNYPSNDPRIIYILVSDDGYGANNSNPKLNLAYYAPVYIEGPVAYTKGSNPTAYLNVRFLMSNLSSSTTGIVLSTGTTDTGLSVARLLG